jgi:hypothetical protein
MTVEQDCLAVLIKQLGPAAKPFLTRQCSHHLKKESAAITEADLDELARWCQIGTELTLGAAVSERVKQGILALKG